MSLLRVKLDTVAKSDFLLIIVDVIYRPIKALSLGTLVHAIVLPWNDYLSSSATQHVLQCFRIGLSLLIDYCTNVISTLSLTRPVGGSSSNRRPYHCIAI